MYKLVIIWENGNKDVYSYESLEKAIDAENGFKVAFGNQIEWTGIINPAY